MCFCFCLSLEVSLIPTNKLWISFYCPKFHRLLLINHFLSFFLSSMVWLDFVSITQKFSSNFNVGFASYLRHFSCFWLHFICQLTVFVLAERKTKLSSLANYYYYYHSVSMMSSSLWYIATRKPNKLETRNNSLWLETFDLSCWQATCLLQQQIRLAAN